ncbi:ArsR/SmtB family transcription factor [Dethiothermospora halolimnae]|uniref:ArsR/SmtB family transcription factor n=1 Tax=Dethiothermospora halolimnae TaxID=3114390 RepID=UPI003CCB8707
MKDTIFKMSSSYLKALAHPTRLKILDILKDKELCVCVILEELQLEQSNVSQHLKVLREQGIVKSRRDGSKIMYKVKDKNVFIIFDNVKESLLNQLEETSAELKKGGV